MKRFVPKNVHIDVLIEKHLCNKCALAVCADFCEDALKVKERVRDRFTYKVYDFVLQELDHKEDITEWVFSKAVE